MSRFVVKEFDSLNAANVKVLEIDNKNLYNDFETEINRDGNLNRQIKIILRRLLAYSQGNKLPITHFRFLEREPGDRFTDFEVKSDNLRLYGFIDKNQNIIVLGGKKTSQDKDITLFRRIKFEFFNSSNDE